MKLVVRFFSLFIMLALFNSLSANQPMDSEQKQIVFIMLGAPGAGKGTQAVRLSDCFKIPQISTGELFRENLRQQTSLGKKAQSYMDQGQLVPDSLVLDMLFERLKQPDCQKGYILDGFPRTIPQAQALQDFLAKKEAKVIVISLEVPDEVILERLTNRLVCEQCGAPYHRIASPPKEEGICDRDRGQLIQRKDDSEAVVRERLKVFHAQTEPVKEFYRQHDNLLLVDGSLSKEATISQIDGYLQTILCE